VLHHHSSACTDTIPISRRLQSVLSGGRRREPHKNWHPIPGGSPESRRRTSYGEDIPGYEAQGTSDYYVDNKAVLNRLHPGDDIRATVYPNDRTLYNLRVVYRRRAK
jgi:hypothetical protein